jgi:hypothetical protein
VRNHRRACGCISLALLAVLAVLASACGIPGDSEPREISLDDLPPALVDPASTQPPVDGDANSIMANLFLVRSVSPGDESLVAVPTEIPRPANNLDLPRVVAETLIRTSPAEVGQDDLVNALSASIEVRSAMFNEDNILDLDLSDLGGPESSLQRLAVAQLVFTLTDLAVPRIDAVRFFVDGKQVPVPVEGSAVAAGTPVRPSDDSGLVPGTSPG